MDQTAHESDPNQAMLTSSDNVPWAQMFPGVEMKLLRCSTETGYWTALLRFEAGAVLPRHQHLGDSEFYIIKGAGNHPQTGHFKAGDYVFERDGAVHDELFVEEEIILYMTSYGPSAFLNPDDSVQFMLDAHVLSAMAGGGGGQAASQGQAASH